VKWLDNYQQVKQLRDALVWLPLWERDKRAFVPEVCMCARLPRRRGSERLPYHVLVQKNLDFRLESDFFESLLVRGVSELHIDRMPIALLHERVVECADRVRLVGVERVAQEAVDERRLPDGRVAHGHDPVRHLLRPDHCINGRWTFLRGVVPSLSVAQ